jgi:hypothetical protein
MGEMSMGLFQHVEGEAAVIINNGVYRQCDVYTRDGYLYAKIAGGFVRLYADGSTTKPKARLDHLTWDAPLSRDATGRLCTPDAARAIPLEEPKHKQLLLGSA